MVFTEGVASLLLKGFALLGLYQATQYIQPQVTSRFLQPQKTFEVAKNVTPVHLADQYRNGCPHHQFDSVRIISRSPEIILIEGFLTKQEAEVLVQMADPLYHDSQVLDYAHPDASTVDKSHRNSRSAYLPLPANPPASDDEIVLQCIEERASIFQGYAPIQNMENLQVVRYTESQEFRAHFDWLDMDQVEAMGEAGNRLSSFFVYLIADCEGGSTVFPEIGRPAGEEWCETLKCQGSNGEEVQWLEVPPKVGTAIFWYNLDMDGQGNRRTLHAGTPVINGTKAGLNIWTRERRFRW